ncbi:hypothetical protein OQA88_9706 [Cercophora sp. LCS_1]
MNSHRDPPPRTTWGPSSGTGSPRSFPNSRVPGRRGFNSTQQLNQNQSSNPAGPTSKPPSELVSFLSATPQSSKPAQSTPSSVTSQTHEPPSQGAHPISPWDDTRSPPPTNNGEILSNLDNSESGGDDSDDDPFGGAMTRLSTDPTAVASELRPVTDTEFYSNLVFLSILRPFMGPHERRDRDIEYVDGENRPIPNPKELQRDFLDRLCYLVDFKKGGDTITAAAVEFASSESRARQGGFIPKNTSGQHLVKIWVAGNNGIQPAAWDALFWLQTLIKNNQNPSNDYSQEFLAQEILEKFIDLAKCPNQTECCGKLLKHTRPGAHRINTYAKKLKIAGKKVISSLNQQQQAGKPEVDHEIPHIAENPMINWIEDLRSERDATQLVSRCFSAWSEEPTRLFLRDPQHPNAPPEMRDFAHYVARLGAHKYAAMKVAAGIKGLKYCNESLYCVEFGRLPLPNHSDMPLQGKVSLVTGGNEGQFEADPWKVMHRLGEKYPADASRLAGGYMAEERRRSSSNRVAYTFSDEIRKFIDRRNGELVTRYHAELQIATWFNASRATFWAEDPYIACSKGACWFCHQYLKFLPPRREEHERFVEPARHNEVLPGVSFPTTKSEAAGTVVQQVKAKMNEMVLKTIKDTLLDPNNVPEYSKHAQSTSTWMDEMEIRSNAAF